MAFPSSPSLWRAFIANRFTLRSQNRVRSIETPYRLVGNSTPPFPRFLSTRIEFDIGRQRSGYKVDLGDAFL
jgi:hypothetical protein